MTTEELPTIVFASRRGGGPTVLSPGWVSISEAANRSGVNRQALWEQIRKGWVSSTVIAGPTKNGRLHAIRETDVPLIRRRARHFTDDERTAIRDEYFADPTTTQKALAAREGCARQTMNCLINRRKNGGSRGQAQS